MPSEIYLGAAKRLAVTEGSLDDWYVSHSPRNSNSYAEGTWCQWVHLARLILANELTAAQMPAHHLPYDDAPHVYADHHPDCTWEADHAE